MAVTLLGAREHTLFAMIFVALSNRRGFTLVEVLVALLMTGVASAGLVAALTGDRTLRDASAAQQFAADRARDRLEALALVRCTTDAAGSTASTFGTERWHASISQSAWSLTDSLILARSAVPVVFQARVACPD
jgi:prepilin-type N-terminal cleavage/methylation domain-containing protein